MKLPQAVSVVILVEHKNSFLMIEEERGGDQGPVWYFPSGALEPGETIANAARREVFEESGYEVAPISIVAIDHGAFAVPDGLLWWRFIISARLTSELRHRVDEVEILNVDWRPIEDFSELHLRNQDAEQLCRLHKTRPGLTLDDCRLSDDGTLQGFFA